MLTLECFAPLGTRTKLSITRLCTHSCPLVPQRCENLSRPSPYVPLAVPSPHKTLLRPLRYHLLYIYGKTRLQLQGFWPSARSTCRNVLSSFSLFTCLSRSTWHNQFYIWTKQACSITTALRFCHRKHHLKWFRCTGGPQNQPLGVKVCRLVPLWVLKSKLTTVRITAIPVRVLS